MEPREGDGSFFNMSRKKKKTKAYLLNSLKQLSIATEEQVAVIKSLTDQNKLHEDWRQMHEILLNKTVELQKLKDRNETLKGNIETALTRLEKAEEDIFTRSEREQRLEQVNEQLSEELKQTQRNLAEVKKELALYQERFKYADEENKTLKVSSEKYKGELEAIKSDFVDEHLKSKLLEQEVVYNTEMMNVGNGARTDLERHIEDLRETLRKERIGAITTELTIDAENECLKSDIHSLSKEIKTLSEQLNEIQREKLLLMSYYTRQLNEPAPGSSHHTRELQASSAAPRAITNDTNGSLSSDNSVKTQDPKPDVLENAKMKYKLMNVENKLFRRQQLVDEMVAYIKEKDPGFNIKDNPYFRVYLDEDLSLRSSDGPSYQLNNSRYKTIRATCNRLANCQCLDHKSRIQ